MRKFALAFVLALSVASCQNPAALQIQSISTVEKSLTVAHLAYNSLSQIIIQSTQTGLLKGANAAKVKIYYDQAGDALSVADKADAAANEPDLIAAVREAQDAIASASVLVKGQ